MEGNMTKAIGNRRVTMQDIARQTGFSINTVSRALRNKDDISMDTRERIQETARQMGYMGNQIASSLRSGRTRTLAVILGNMSNPFYGIMADTIQDVAASRGYSLLIMCSRDRVDLEEQMVENAVARRVDGIILFPTNESLSTIQRLQSLGVPFVLMARALGDGVADSVTSDEVRGAYLAVDHLIRQGRRNLAYLSHHRIVYSYEKRLEGFALACDRGNIPPENRHFYIHSDSTAEAPVLDWHASLTNQLMRLADDGVDGLFVFCDEEAWHVQSVIQQSPLLQDWDVGIVSFDNIQGVQHFPAALCSVDCSFTEMARQGIDMLRNRIHGDTRPPQAIVSPVRLVCRGSCKPRS